MSGPANMIEPIHSLAFSIQSNPGVYAVLIGSGVSRAAGVIVVLIMRFRRRGCFLGGFSSVNYEISTGTLGQSLLVDCVALLLFQNSRSVRQ